MNTTRRHLVIGLCLAALAGCDRAERTPSHAPPPAPASGQEQEKTLLIGLIPEQNIFEQVKRYQPVARYLSSELKLDVQLKLLSRYGNVIENFSTMELDGAFFGSFTYALAHERLGVEPLARPVNPDETSTYFGLVFIRKDSGIHNIEDLRGKRFAFVDKATTAGYLLPLDFFYESGIRDYESFLGEVYFAGTHEDAIYDVLNGKADIGAAKNTVFAMLVARDERVASELRILARSPDVPENGLALRRDIDPELRDGLRRTLLAMHETPRGQAVLKRFGALRFVETTDADYAAVYKYAREVGLDLSSYDYVND